ncbi:hypothetical protein GUJ93_ZPchr0062g7136 [Zizania palustris]|uniref:Uncharacterized protein n=1 Tax=Zizania palustris TaxID=103762 RepID=A0A8J5RPW4_ZIZPA|nr:hypothetical protein GUJ93_ZPchr0062g7133 [Zizania palustris]KAG8044557.1 hypothetical protein GUJ93_ZPchr0062g7136 [Zizania palustris]
MAKDENGSARDDATGEEEAVRSRSKSMEADEEERSKGSRDRRGKSKRQGEDERESEITGQDSGERRKRRRKEKERHRRRRRSRSQSESSGSSSESQSESESSYSDSGAESESGIDSEEERRRRRRRKRKEKEEEDRRRRRKEKERRKRKEKEKERERKKKEKKKRKEEKKNLGKKAAVTNSWGKYGIIREVDMWNKRPEFTAWLSEVKQVNLESLSNWEEKQMFKEFMEDHNTATFPSKKYYDLDAYHHRMVEKERKKGLKNAVGTERTIFNDEEQRRLELLRERERQKEEEVAALKRSMQTGMAQAMKEQARLREEMMYQYRLGNFEAAAAIQKRLDPDAPLQ